MNIIDIIFTHIDDINLILSDENYQNISKILFFIFLFIYQTIGLPGHAILMLIAGFIYGTYLGFILCLISIVSGSFIFYLFGKNVLFNYFSRFAEKYLNKIDEYISGNKFEYIVIFRLFPGTPLFLQNLILSFLNIGKRKFILATLLGNIPGTFVVVHFGNQIKNLKNLENFAITDIFSLEFYISIFLIITLLCIKIFLSKKK